MIDFSEIDNTVEDSNHQTAYDRYLYDFIRATEGGKQAVYLDTQKIPSIGIGYNLTDENILGLVLTKFGVTDQAAQKDIKDIINNHRANNTNPQTDLNAKMAQLAAEVPKLADRSTFTFSAGEAGVEERKGGH